MAGGTSLVDVDVEGSGCIPWGMSSPLGINGAPLLEPFPSKPRSQLDRTVCFHR